MGVTMAEHVVVEIHEKNFTRFRSADRRRSWGKQRTLRVTVSSPAENQGQYRKKSSKLSAHEVSGLYIPQNSPQHDIHSKGRSCH